MLRTVLCFMLAVGVGSVTVSAPREAAAQSRQVRVVASSLLDFERSVSWAAVSPAWRVARPGWLQQVRAADSPRELGKPSAKYVIARPQGRPQGCRGGSRCPTPPLRQIGRAHV